MTTSPPAFDRRPVGTGGQNRAHHDALGILFDHKRLPGRRRWMSPNEEETIMTSHIASRTLRALGRGAAFAAALALTAPAFAGSHDVTLLLRSGERITGELASLDRSSVDVRDTDGGRHAVAVSDVVLMDFQGAARLANRTDIDRVRNAGHLLVMYDGTTRQGHVVDIVGESGADAAVVFESAAGQREEIPLNDVNRVYLQPVPPEVTRTLGITH